VHKGEFLHSKVKVKSKLFLPIGPFINSFWKIKVLGFVKIRVLGPFLNILCVFMSKIDLTLAFCATTGSKCSGDDDLRVVFYTFSDSVKTRKSHCWSHL